MSASATPKQGDHVFNAIESAILRPFELHHRRERYLIFLSIRGKVAGAVSTLRDKIACYGRALSADVVRGKAMDRVCSWRVDRTCDCHLAGAD
jgi:hypothetical protein